MSPLHSIGTLELKCPLERHVCQWDRPSTPQGSSTRMSQWGSPVNMGWCVRGARSRTACRCGRPAWGVTEQCSQEERRPPCVPQDSTGHGPARPFSLLGDHCLRVWTPANAPVPLLLSPPKLLAHRVHVSPKLASPLGSSGRHQCPLGPVGPRAVPCHSWHPMSNWGQSLRGPCDHKLPRGKTSSPMPRRGSRTVRTDAGGMGHPQLERTSLFLCHR